MLQKQKKSRSIVQWHQWRWVAWLNIYKTASSVPVLSCNIRHYVLVEELQNEGDAVGKHQMLSHVLKLRDKQWHFSQEERLTPFLFVSRRKRQQEGGYVFYICHKYLWTWPGRCGLVWSVLEAAAGWQRWPSRWSPCVDWHQRRVSCFAAPWSCARVNQNLDFILMWFIQLRHPSPSTWLWILIHLKMQLFSHLSYRLKLRSDVVPVTNAAPPWRWTYGISSGSTSARMLIESVLALEVGAAASRIFSSAI